MKIRKRFNYLVLIVAILFVLGGSVFALADESKRFENVGKRIASTNKINEYDYFEELNQKSTPELLKIGFTPKEIQQIRHFHSTYVAHLHQVKQLDPNSLQRHGYTNKQIELLRKYDGSIGMTKLLAANLSLSLWTSDFVFDGNYTNGYLGYSWNWNGIPAFKMQDAVAVSWNNWAVQSNSSNVRYYSVNTGQYVTQQSAVFTNDGNGLLGAGHKFNMARDDNLNYAKEGSGSFRVKSDVQWKKDFYYYIAYGHSQVHFNINFSISAGGLDGSISFTVGSVIEASSNGVVVAK